MNGKREHLTETYEVIQYSIFVKTICFFGIALFLMATVSSIHHADPLWVIVTFVVFLILSLITLSFVFSTKIYYSQELSYFVVCHLKKMIYIHYTDCVWFKEEKGYIDICIHEQVYHKKIAFIKSNTISLNTWMIGITGFEHLLKANVPSYDRIDKSTIVICSAEEKKAGMTLFSVSCTIFTMILFLNANPSIEKIITIFAFIAICSIFYVFHMQFVKIKYMKQTKTIILQMGKNQQSIDFSQIRHMHYARLTGSLVIIYMQKSRKKRVKILQSNQNIFVLLQDFNHYSQH